MISHHVVPKLSYEVVPKLSQNCAKIAPISLKIEAVAGAVRKMFQSFLKIEFVQSDSVSIYIFCVIIWD